MVLLPGGEDGAGLVSVLTMCVLGLSAAPSAFYHMIYAVH